MSINPSATSLVSSSLAGLDLLYRGKVRDIYAIDDKHLLLVASDRISAFDCILPTPISGKGTILTALSRFWFERLSDITGHHLITTDIGAMPYKVKLHAEVLRERSMLVRRTKVFPVECVVRGYLAGSGWKDYRRTGEVCAHRLPGGLREGARLPAPVFTPATKASTGHDENISEAQMANIIGAENAEYLRAKSLALYRAASVYAESRGIIIADTKFEFGVDDTGEIILIDEALTPDSSRFWDAAHYAEGAAQPSFDKQFVRDYLETLDWNKQPPAPELPPEIVAATLERYRQAYQLLTANNATF